MFKFLRPAQAVLSHLPEIERSPSFVAVAPPRTTALLKTIRSIVAIFERDRDGLKKEPAFAGADARLRDDVD